MKTCKPAIQTIIRLSMTLKLKILLSVLLTVLKLRFSRVRKYFWLRVMVESWPESLKIDSSRAEVCSGDVPSLKGSWASRCSFSTCSYPSISASAVNQSGKPIVETGSIIYGREDIRRSQNPQTCPQKCSFHY